MLKLNTTLITLKRYTLKRAKPIFAFNNTQIILAYSNKDIKYML